MINKLYSKSKRLMTDTSAELAYISTTMKIMIVIVIGFLLLTLICILFKDTIIPVVQDKWNTFMDYAGEILEEAGIGG